MREERRERGRDGEDEEFYLFTCLLGTKEATTRT